MRKFKLSNMHKSTKIMLIILGVIVVVGAALVIIYRHQIFAQNIPEPEGNERDKIVFQNGERVFLPLLPCDDANTNSGGIYYIECKTKDQVNAAPENHGKYTLTFKYRIKFEKACDEYIDTGSEYTNISWDLSGKNQTRLNDLPYNGSKNFDITRSATHTFNMNEEYGYYVGVLVRRNGWPLNPEQGPIYSNVCRIKKATNPEESVGQEIVTPNRPDFAEPEIRKGECTRQCQEKSGCENKVKIIGKPICNAMCATQCSVLDMMASIFNWAFKLLQGAVGIS